MTFREAPPAERARHDDSVTLLLCRVRGEFLELPGLRLTSAQASRLWALDHQTSQRILEGLTKAGFLVKTRENAYVRASVA
jgi:Fic family protein